MNRRKAAAAFLALGAGPFQARAQASRKPHRIGFLGLSSASDYAPLLAAFHQGLRELGYEDGKNIVIEYRWADRREERLPELAAQLARLDPELIVTHATGVRAAQQATLTIPIVMGASADPVGLGLIKSLAQPGGNTTGVASQMVDLSGKRLELLREIAPSLKDVAVISHRSNPGARRGLEETEVAARKLGIKVRSHWVDSEAPQFDSVFAAILRERPDGLIVQPYPYSANQSVRIATFASTSGLPSMGGGSQFVVDGGLIAYGADFAYGWRAAARFVDKILKGAKPADLPVEQPTKFELSINLNTARALKLTLPTTLLLRADTVIQ